MKWNEASMDVDLEDVGEEESEFIAEKKNNKKKKKRFKWIEWVSVFAAVKEKIRSYCYMKCEFESASDTHFNILQFQW
jgi:hypothetical protein